MGTAGHPGAADRPVRDAEGSPVRVVPRLGLTPGQLALPADEVQARRYRRAFRHWSPVAFGLLVIDAASLVLALGFSAGALTVAALAVPGLVALNVAGGLYRSRLNLSVLDDSPSLVTHGLVTLAVSSATVSMVGWRIADEWRANLLVTTALYTVFVLFGRGAGYPVIRRLRSSRRMADKTLVLGSGHIGRQFVSTLLEHPEYGLQPVGFADRSGGQRDDQLPLPLLGEPHELAQVITTHDVRKVIITFGMFRDSDLVDAIRTCDKMPCEVFIMPRLFELNATTDRRVEDVFGFPCLRLRQLSRRSAQGVLKRAIDITVAAMALILLSPVLIACAAAVRIEMGPSVIFRQKRVGLAGSHFLLLKFCTLKPASEEESATRWTIRHDVRIGPVGRFLRNTSLDELPQLWNVLVGDMSLVGPRPERPHFVNQFSERFRGYADRHRVPAGMTGWAQIHGLRGDTSIEDRVRFDNQYIERWSLWQDVKILLRTVASPRRPGGDRANRGPELRAPRRHAPRLRGLRGTGIRRPSHLPPHVPRWRWREPLKQWRSSVPEPAVPVSQGGVGAREAIRHDSRGEKRTDPDLGAR